MNQTLESIVELQGKKPHQPNWEHDKILVFIFKAKINEYVVNMDKIDGRHQFKSRIIIWKKNINMHVERRMFNSPHEWCNM